MLIGVDLDNTIICYDKLFYSVALEYGWISASTPKTKERVKKHVLESLGNETWTLLQVQVYGPRLNKAEPYPHVLDFFKACKKADIGTTIISHKTKSSALGEPYDLRTAAKNWLINNGFVDAKDTNLSDLNVCFYETREEKIDAISANGCNIFIDDLPEVFDDLSFDPIIQRILFDPNHYHKDTKPYTIAHTWTELMSEVSLIVGSTIK